MRTVVRLCKKAEGRVLRLLSDVCHGHGMGTRKHKYYISAIIRLQIQSILKDE